jgi:hypothetical protein
MGHPGVCGGTTPPCDDRAVARMGHPAFVAGWRKADPSASLRDDKQRGGMGRLHCKGRRDGVLVETVEVFFCGFVGGLFAFGGLGQVGA